jgi:hypothetical protein
LKIRVKSQTPVSQQHDTEEVKIQKLKNMIREGTEECRYYLTENNWDIIAALNAWQVDCNWEVDLIGGAVQCEYQCSRVVIPHKIEMRNPSEHEDDAKPLLGTYPVRYVV